MVQSVIQSVQLYQLQVFRVDCDDPARIQVSFFSSDTNESRALTLTTNEPRVMEDAILSEVRRWLGGIRFASITANPGTGDGGP